MELNGDRNFFATNSWLRWSLNVGGSGEAVQSTPLAPASGGQLACIVGKGDRLCDIASEHFIIRKGRDVRC